jgi:hypothetical protein
MGIHTEQKKTIQPSDQEAVFHHIWSPGFALLRAVDAAETDAFRAWVLPRYHGRLSKASFCLLLHV